nr:MAG TPA: hypothetical protein [Caudoviricetes sp.]
MDYFRISYSERVLLAAPACIYNRYCVRCRSA